MGSLRLEVEVPEAFLGNILVTAFDGACGGSWFWCHSNREIPINERFLMDDDDDVLSIWRHVHIITDHEEDAFKVDHNVLIRGMQAILEQPDGHWETLKRHIGQGVMDDDAGDIDANEADTIVQFGLFGKEVYA